MTKLTSILLLAFLLVGCSGDHRVCVKYDGGYCQRYEPKCKAWIREDVYGNYSCEK